MARPVLAPSDTPAADSMYVVADEAPAMPPAVAASESTSSTRLSRGSFPSRSSQPASPPIPITVPIVSKKSESMMEKMVTAAATTPTRQNTSTFRPAPSVDRSGSAQTFWGITA